MCKTNGNLDTDVLQRYRNQFELDESLWNDNCKLHGNRNMLQFKPQQLQSINFATEYTKYLGTSA